MRLITLRSILAAVSTPISSSRRCSRTWSLKKKIFRQPRPSRQARRDPRHQHLDARHRRDRRGHDAATGRDRPALLQPGERHAAARNRAGRQDSRRCIGDRAGARKKTAQGRRRGAGLLRLHRQPHDGPLCARGRACVLEGATPQEVDWALEDFGMAMGILAVFDMAGVDVGHLTRVALGNAFHNDPTFYRPSAMLTERGWLGQKTGRGYYRYEDGKRVVDQEVITLLHAEGSRSACRNASRAPRKFANAVSTQ